MVHREQSGKSDTQTIKYKIVILVLKTSSEAHVYTVCGWLVFFFFLYLKYGLPLILSHAQLPPLTPPTLFFFFLQKSTNAQIFLGVQSAKEISVVQVFHLKTKTQLNETLAQSPIEAADTEKSL